jgi:type II secretory pathway predicted ATPase ExeA
MYEEFYSLKEKPFALVADPAYLYMSQGHERAMALLQYSLLSGQGFSVLTGEIGAGKTTIVNYLLEHLDEDTTVGVLSFTNSVSAQLIEWISMIFDLEYEGKSEVQLYEQFLDYLVQQYAAGNKTLLIIDEAQNMRISGLEKVRMLSNVNASKDYLLHMILVGQPELRSLLAQRQLKQLLQRVSVSYHLDSLSHVETKRYIEHRLRIAGRNEALFNDQAIALIAGASRGVPRLINSLCDLALVYGYSARKKIIDAEMAQAVLQDREKMGLSAPKQGPTYLRSSHAR